MAEGKNSFVLYVDNKDVFDCLTDEQAGKLIKHIFAFVNDENPEFDDNLLKIASIPIIRSLKRDLKKWERIREKRSLAGKASAEKRKQSQQVLTSVESVEQDSTNSTVSVNDSVSVNVSVNDSVSVNNNNVIYKEEEKKQNSISSRQNEMKKNLLSQAIWMEDVGMKFSGKDIPKLLEKFCDHEILIGGLLRSEWDIKRHFINTIRENKKVKQSDGTVDAFEEYAKLSGKRYD